MSELMESLEEFFFTLIEYNANGNIIYTAKDINTVQCNGTKGVTYPIFSHYGFIRAICNKDGNVLAYIRASRILPDPFPSKFHQGTWYAFDEYNPELMGSFKFGTPGYLFDRTDAAQWRYDAATRGYNLDISTPVGPIEHWFITSDKDITADYGMCYTRTYNYDVRNKEPNPKIVGSIQVELQRKGVIPKPKTLKTRKLFNNIKLWLYGIRVRQPQH